MKTIFRTSTPALHTHSTVIQLKDGNVGTRILLTGIDHLTIGCLYMYADDVGYYHDPSSSAFTNVVLVVSNNTIIKTLDK